MNRVKIRKVRNGLLLGVMLLVVLMLGVYTAFEMFVWFIGEGQPK